jgi:hypothetical protein
VSFGRKAGGEMLLSVFFEEKLDSGANLKKWTINFPTSRAKIRVFYFKNNDAVGLTTTVRPAPLIYFKKLWF